MQTELDAGGITVAEGVELAKLSDPARVEAVRQRSRRHGWTVAEAVREQLREIEADEARRKGYEQLRAKGVAIIKDPPRYGWYDRKEKPLGKGYGQVDLSVARHAKERCHAAAVDHDGEIVYVCTNPRRHAKDDAAQSAATKAAKEAEAKKRAQRKALREAAAARGEVIAGLLGRRVAKGELWAFVMRQMVAQARNGPAKSACGFLGLEPVYPYEGSPYKDWGAALGAYVVGGDEALDRAALALAFAAAEDLMNAEWNTWATAEVTNHLEFLARVGGYQLSAVEREKLGQDADEEDAHVGGGEL